MWKSVPTGERANNDRKNFNNISITYPLAMCYHSLYHVTYFMECYMCINCIVSDLRLRGFSEADIQKIKTSVENDTYVVKVKLEVTAELSADLNVIDPEDPIKKPDIEHLKKAIAESWDEFRRVLAINAAQKLVPENVTLEVRRKADNELIYEGKFGLPATMNSHLH